jgi:hypothetical protein
MSKTKPDRKLLYLRLFHRRKDTKQYLDDWVSDGPLFGPYEVVTTSHGQQIKMGPGTEKHEFDVLLVEGDSIYYGGMEYWDWAVFVGPLSEVEQKHLQPFKRSHGIDAGLEWLMSLRSPRNDMAVEHLKRFLLGGGQPHSHLVKSDSSLRQAQARVSDPFRPFRQFCKNANKGRGYWPRKGSDQKPIPNENELKRPSAVRNCAEDFCQILTLIRRDIASRNPNFNNARFWRAIRQ